MVFKKTCTKSFLSKYRSKQSPWPN